MKSALFAVGALGEVSWNQFQAFKEQYSLVFTTLEEESHRFNTFKANHARALKLNAKSGGKARYGTTKFSHLTKEEFKAKHTGYKPMKNRPTMRVTKTEGVTAGDKDWRGTGAVTPVKNQGACGSCWAFSATEAVETGYFFTTGNQVELSSQQTVSCDRMDGACGGGDTLTAYRYMEHAGGVEKDSDFPYTSGDTGGRGRCRSNKKEFVAKVKDVKTVSQGAEGEANMFDTIMKTPMSICVDAETWQLYDGGVVDSSTCGTELDHCVQAVAIKSGEYWVVKNQWEADWGEDGYIRVKTGENACGVAMEATYVDVVAMDAKNLNDGTTDAIDVIKGLSEGFGLPMETQCVDSSSDMIEALAAAYAKMQEKNPIAMAMAVKMVADALKNDWPKAAAACSATKDELNRLIASLEIMSHPKEFVYHIGQDLEINGVSIYSNMNDSVGHWTKKEYHDFGFSLGSAMRLLVIGKSNEIYA